MASYERRKQEWAFQRELAQQDVLIGAQQVANAIIRVRVVGQERVIAQLQTDNATTTVRFLDEKFTDEELYFWMSSVLQGVYSFFLHQATAVAKIAEDQLAFERQQAPQGLIQADYWEPPSDDGIGGGLNGRVDRHGLTGSARLIEDITRLDEFAFHTDERKLQLTKSISLARLDPYAFQVFREAGVLTIATRMEEFDKEFPGDHHRLIKRVRTSVIALVPPTDGIRATLSVTGPSRVVINGNGFRTVPINHGPQSVGLSSAMNETGVFVDLNPNPEMLLPFERLGVDTTWQLSMPKAANPSIDYSTIADVLLTIEYTALHSDEYRQQVIAQLSNTVSASRPFSFRHQLADAWYDLHNPDQAPLPPMTVRFRTVRQDFPPNIKDLHTAQLLLYFSRAEGESFEVEVTHLHLTDEAGKEHKGGSAISTRGVISTEGGNAPSWLDNLCGPTVAPIGEWELALKDKTPDGKPLRDLFKKGAIKDILFVITFGGESPKWPL